MIAAFLLFLKDKELSWGMPAVATLRNGRADIGGKSETTGNRVPEAKQNVYRECTDKLCV
jgi:hypothetical protein